MVEGDYLAQTLQLLQARLAPRGYDRILTEAERTRLISDVAEVDRAWRNTISSANQVLRDAYTLGIAPEPSFLARRQSAENLAPGSCVVTVKLPLPANARQSRSVDPEQESACRLIGHLERPLIGVDPMTAFDP